LRSGGTGPSLSCCMDTPRTAIPGRRWQRI
jgi:hypothetical protein